MGFLDVVYHLMLIRCNAVMQSLVTPLRWDCLQSPPLPRRQHWFGRHPYAASGHVLCLSCDSFHDWQVLVDFSWLLAVPTMFINVPYLHFLYFVPRLQGSTCPPQYQFLLSVASVRYQSGRILRCHSAGFAMINIPNNPTLVVSRRHLNTHLQATRKL